MFEIYKKKLYQKLDKQRLVHEHRYIFYFFIVSIKSSSTRSLFTTINIDTSSILSIKSISILFVIISIDTSFTLSKKLFSSKIFMFAIAYIETTFIKLSKQASLSKATSQTSFTLSSSFTSKTFLTSLFATLSTTSLSS